MQTVLASALPSFHLGQVDRHRASPLPALKLVCASAACTLPPYPALIM